MKNLGKLKNGQLKQSGCFNANFGFSLLSRKFPALLLVLLLLFLLPATRMRAQSSCPTGLGESAENPFLIPDTATFYAFARCLTPGSVFYYDCENATFTSTVPVGSHIEIGVGGENKHFKLTNNLVLNKGDISGCEGLNKGYDNEPWREWVPMHTFNGHFDGGFHTISGIFLPNGGNQSALFYSVSTGGEVKNLGVTNAYISGVRYVGGIAGSTMQDGIIQNCFFEGRIVASDDYCGGIVGLTEGSSLITNCYTTGSLYGNGLYTGGIVGGNNTTVSNCYSSMYVSNSAGGGTVGGIYGRNEGDITNCYYDMQMTDFATNPNVSSKLTMEMTISNFTNLGAAFVPQAGFYPYLAGFDFAHNPAVKLSVLPVFFYAMSSSQYETASDLTEPFTVGNIDGAVWTAISLNNCVTLEDNTATLHKQGVADLVVSLNGVSRTYVVYPNIAPFLGSENNPFTIDNLADLVSFRNGINGGVDFTYKRYQVIKDNLINTYWLQTADIDLSTIATWAPIGNQSAIPFKGHYNGGDKTIRNMTTGTGDCQGFFGRATNAYISHLKIKEIKMVGVGSSSGAICGYITNTTVEYCSAESSTTISGGNTLGGVIGGTAGTSYVRHCHNKCNVIQGSSGDCVGGIVGRVNSIAYIEDCHNEGNITTTSSSTSRAGGVLGGISGDPSFTSVSFCSNSGKVTGSSCIGGIVGWAAGKGEIKYCINTGEVISSRANNTDGNFGGISGYTSTNIKPMGCINTGEVTTPYAGYGISSTTNTNCMNAGKIKMKYIGGAAGNYIYGIGGTANKCINVALIEGCRTATVRPVSYYSTTTSFYDKQLMPNATAQTSYGRTTAQMIGTESTIKTQLGNEWLYEEGMYPRLKWTDTVAWARPIAIAASTPVLLSSDDQDVDHVKDGLKIFGCGSNVTWKVMPLEEGQTEGACLFTGVSAGSNLPNTGCTDNAITPELQDNCFGATVIGAFVHDTVLVKRVSLRHYVKPVKDTLHIYNYDDLVALRDGINSDNAFKYHDTLVPRFADSIHFMLCNDIALTEENWTAIGCDVNLYFKGVFPDFVIAYPRSYRQRVFQWVCGVS